MDPADILGNLSLYDRVYLTSGSLHEPSLFKYVNNYSALTLIIFHASIIPDGYLPSRNMSQLLVITHPP